MGSVIVNTSNDRVHARGLSKKAWLSVITFALWVCCTFMFERSQIVGIEGVHRAAAAEEVAITAKHDAHSSKSAIAPAIKLSPVHVLFSLSGNHTGFISEFEVALKSVMMNAPLERDMTVHIMADGLAFNALDEVFERAEIELWEGRTRISIQSYNVERYLPAWKEQVVDLLGSTGFSKVPRGQVFGVHTIGCWFRLFCHHILPKTVEHVLYMDTDVVMMANLEEVWRHADANYHFQWGIMECSGFLLLNVPKLSEVWQDARTLPLYNISEATRQSPNDQLVFRAISAAHRERGSLNGGNHSGAQVGTLPEEWDISIAAGIWEFKDQLVQRRSQVGYIHFNGQGASKEAYFAKKTDFLDVPETRNSFQLAKYYIYMPWTWARFQAASQISGDMTADGQRPEGFALRLIHRTNAPSELKLLPL